MATGLSIHIGLNSVDPAEYDGWSGDLTAGESDAHDMAAIAEGNGFRTTTILTAEATSKKVLGAIASAARKLKAGDTLLLTYSGHGGQVPDLDGDERDDQDETWVLYDRQVLDDELYAAYGQFADGVRIAVLSDSCHSGSVTRVGPPCVVLISGCQDNQLSLDGTSNGLFTATLLTVWNGGAFAGSYRKLHRLIGAQMPSTQSPRLSVVGRYDRDFATVGQAFSL